jgi:hypothetical protein
MSNIITIPSWMDSIILNLTGSVYSSIEELKESILFQIQRKNITDCRLLIYKKILITINQILKMKNRREILLT